MKPIKLVAEGIGVDAGMIIVADYAYFDKKRKDDLSRIVKDGQVLPVPNGIYQVHFLIDDTWNGEVTMEKTLTVTSGKIVVIDPCYVIGAADKKDYAWQKWLGATDYGHNIGSNAAFICDDMGGDGSYKVQLELREIK